MGGLFDLTTQRVIVVTLLALYFTTKKSVNSGSNPLTNPIIAVVVWMLLSALNSVVVSVSVKSGSRLVLDYICVYYIYARCVRKPKTVHKIMFAFVAAMLVCSICGYIEAYWDWNVISIFPPSPHRFSGLATAGDRDSRVQSSFGHAILLFGSALAMTLPMVIYLISVSKRTIYTALLWCTTALMFLNLYKTTSRGPWLAAIIGLALTLLLGNGRMRRAVLIICLLSAIVLIARPGVWLSVYNLYGETINPNTAQGESYQWRYALYNIAYQHLNGDWRRALLGYGPESFDYLGWHGNFQGYNAPFESCDSSIAALMIETGYVGLALVGVLISKLLYIGYEFFRKGKKPDQLVCMVFVVSTLLFCFMMSNVAIFGWGQQSYMLWIGLALTVTCPRLAESPALVVARREPIRFSRFHQRPLIHNNS